MSGDSKVWAHSSADTWAAQSGISTYDLDTSSIKREKVDTSEQFNDGYGPPPGSASTDPASYVADPTAFYNLYSNMGAAPTTTPMMHHEMGEAMKRDKDAIYAHPLYPLLVVLFEKCELATSTPRETSRDGTTSSDVCSSASFKDDLNEFVRHTQENADKQYYVPNPQLDQIMLQSIQMLRFHLLELEKVHELCDNFCNRYVTCLKGKMPLDIVGDERASSSQPPMSPGSMGHHGHSSSPSMAGAATPMGHYPPYEPQSVPLPENAGVLGHSLEGSSMAYAMAGMAAAAAASSSSAIQPGDHPLVNGGTLHTTAGASQTLLPVAVRSPSTCSSGGLRQDSTPLPGETPTALANGNSLDSISEAGDEFSVCGSNEDGRESVLSDSANGSQNGKRKVPKVFSKEAITKFRAWLFQNLTHPYPSEEQKRSLAQETGLTILQVNNWFINARRRIVQPMIDQNNRAGRVPQMNVTRNRRRNRSEQSPGPSPDSGSDSGANYSPDPAALAAATMHYPGAELYMQRTMNYGAFPSFPNPAMPFMNPMMGFPVAPTVDALAPSWVDLSTPHE
ncbi:unnamed protein product [Caenorhabditis sp. 36 PRJEB53466]|nr:unnamed protein product [Caenorhabditis sp. 36 PRJEB53466]